MRHSFLLAVYFLVVEQKSATVGTEPRPYPNGSGFCVPLAKKKTASGNFLVNFRIPLHVESNFLCSKYVAEFAAEKFTIQFRFPLQNPLPRYEPKIFR